MEGKFHSVGYKLPLGKSALEKFNIFYALIDSCAEDDDGFSLIEDSKIIYDYGEVFSPSGDFNGRDEYGEEFPLGEDFDYMDENGEEFPMSENLKRTYEDGDGFPLGEDGTNDDDAYPRGVFPLSGYFTRTNGDSEEFHASEYIKEYCPSKHGDEFPYRVQNDLREDNIRLNNDESSCREDNEMMEMLQANIVSRSTTKHFYINPRYSNYTRYRK